MSSLGSIAGIVAGFKAGEITEMQANRLLRQLGVDNDISTYLSIGAGIVGGIIAGDLVSDAVSEIFNLFD